jgi:hypothetical protein
VDVLAGSKMTNVSVPAPDIFPPIMPSQTTVNYFIPPPGKWTIFQIVPEAEEWHT